MKTVLLVLCATALATCSFCLPASFQDNFDRPNSDDIGNGWSKTSGDIRGSLVLRDGAVTALATDGYAGMCRPWQFTGTVTVTATISDISGFAGVRSRFVSKLLVKNSGDCRDGYGISIERGDENADDSRVAVVDSGQATGVSARSTFQFKERLLVVARFAPDGSIDGSVTEGTDTFLFSFGPTTSNSTGDNVAWCTSFPDSRSASPTYPTLDDFTISSQGTSRATVTYSYDSLNRLTTSLYSYGSQEHYAYDPAGNRLRRALVAARDDYAPAVPLHLRAHLLSSESATLNWDATTDAGGSGVAGYIVYLDGGEVARTTSTNAILGNLQPESHYCATVAAYDHMGNLSEMGLPACFTTPAPPEDTQPPLLVIESAVSGAVVYTNLFTLSGSATDAGVGDNGIQGVTVNGTLAEGGLAIRDESAAWSIVLPLSLGKNEFDVVVVDGSAAQNRATHHLVLFRSVSQGDPPAVLGSPALDEGIFKSSLAGSAGLTYNVWSSTDLVTWTWLTNITFTNWLCEFQAPTSTSSTYCFYAFGPGSVSSTEPRVVLRRSKMPSSTTPLALGDDGRFYGTLRDGIFCMDSTNLNQIWTLPAINGCKHFPASAIALTASGIAFVVGERKDCGIGRLIAISASNGHFLWQLANAAPRPQSIPGINDAVTSVYYGAHPCCAVEYSRAIARWKMDAGTDVEDGGIAIDSQGNVFLASHVESDTPETVVASISDSGVLNWTRSVSGVDGLDIVAIPTRSILLLQTRSALLAWDSTTGADLWSAAALQHPVTDPRGNLYCNTSEQPQLVSLSTNGVERWRVTLDTTSPLTLDFIDEYDVLYARAGKTIFAVSAQNGTLLWTYSASTLLVGNAVLGYGGRLVLSDADGTYVILNTTVNYALSSWPIATYGNRRHTSKESDTMAMPGLLWTP